jgi:hypothetical protein
VKDVLKTYDGLISNGLYTFRNYLVFRWWPLNAIWKWHWEKPSRRGPEGINLEDARAVKEAVSIPVVCTGGFQTASVIAGAIDRGDCDGVTLARALIANRLPDPHQLGPEVRARRGGGDHLLERAGAPARADRAELRAHRPGRDDPVLPEARAEGARARLQVHRPARVLRPAARPRRDPVREGLELDRQGRRRCSRRRPRGRTSAPS